MAEDLGEKTELPTSRRRGEARERGQVARSTFLGPSVGMISGLIILVVMGSTITAGLAAILRTLLDVRATATLDVEHIASAARWAFTHAALLSAPFFLVLVLVALLSEIVQVGWHPTTQPLSPSLERLDPLKGIGKLFGKRNLIRTLISLGKLIAAVVVVVIIAVQEWTALLTLAFLDIGPMVEQMLRILYRICVWLLALLAVVAVIDLVYQRWQLTQDLRMTKQEVKEEQKQQEGDLELKGRRLRLARQIALQRINSAVPKADVIVTNPTHFAVALKYEPGTMAAPKVVAKGSDYLAFRIREVAAAHNIPIVERPPLARALYTAVPVGKQIKPEFYEAVAEILAFVYRVSGRAA